MLIQFSSIPGDAEFKDLADKGIRLHTYLGDLAYWATVPENSRTETLMFLRAIVRPEPGDKIIPFLKDTVAPKQPAEVIPVMLMTRPGTTIEELLPHLMDLNIEPDTEEMLYGDRLMVHVPVSKLNALAESDLILVLEPGEIAKTLHNLRSSNYVGSTDARAEYGLSGDGVNVGIWDGGSLYNHKEFKGRFKNVETDWGVHYHATHVAGTIGATGKLSTAKGMAPGAFLYSYDYGDDVGSEMNDAKKKFNIILSNNSWGFIMGWEYGRYTSNGQSIVSFHGNHLFGAYTSASSTLDNLVRNKGLIIVFSAGNDRNDSYSGVDYWDVVQNKWVYGPFSGHDGPYNIVGPTGVAKNVICVGAMDAWKSSAAAPEKTDNKIYVADFSSYGPSDSGQIKPEVSAPGVNVYSTYLDNKYYYISGTSMACPVTTGSLALWVEAWRDVFGKDPNPAVIRAILAATASDIDKPGPDYAYGFGILNVLAGVDCIYTNAATPAAPGAGKRDFRAIKALSTPDKSARQITGSGRSALPPATTVLEGKVKRGKTVNVQLTVGSGFEELRLSLAWLDPVGAKLVNDLDLRLIDPNGKKYYPWMLNPKKYTKKAKRTNNDVDNIEVVSLDYPMAGEWTIQVTGTRLGQGSKQKFALALWGN